MAVLFDPSKFILAAYKGVLAGKPVSYCTTPERQSKVLPLSFNWNTDYPTSAVTVNLMSGGTTYPLDKMVGLYINNTSNSGSVIVTVPDTGQVIEQAFQSSGFYPLFTQTNILNVYNFSASASGQTSIIVTNFPVDSFSDNLFNFVLPLVQESSLLSGGVGTQQFVSPVVGDRHRDNNFSMSASFVTTLVPSVGAGTFIITAMRIAIQNAYCDGAPTSNVSGAIGFTQNGLASGALKQVPLVVNTSQQYIPFTNLIADDDLYEVYNGALPIQAFSTVVPSVGFAYFSIDYLWTIQQ